MVGCGLARNLRGRAKLNFSCFFYERLLALSIKLVDFQGNKRVEELKVVRTEYSFSQSTIFETDIRFMECVGVRICRGSF